MFETKALSKPSIRLNKDDLPVLGGPKNKTLFFDSFLLETNELSIKSAKEDFILTSLSLMFPATINHDLHLKNQCFLQ